MTTMTRKVLYEKVWSEPMQHLAKSLSISGVGLAKVCRRYKIPVPPRGYWAKKAAGKKPPRNPLANPQDDSNVYFGGIGTAEPPTLEEQLREQLADETSKPFDVDFRNHFRKSHALVMEAKYALASSTPDEYGRTSCGDSSLTLKVSGATRDRALHVTDAILRAFGNRGFSTERGPTIEILGMPVSFSLSELLVAQRVEDSSIDFTSTYKFCHSRFKTVHVLSGKITLEIGPIHLCPRGVRRIWRETDTSPIESKLHDICAGLVAFAVHAKQYRPGHRHA